MIVDSTLVKNFVEKHKVQPTCATRHVQTNSAVSVHETKSAALLDRDERNVRAKMLGIKASYDVQPL